MNRWTEGGSVKPARGRSRASVFSELSRVDYGVSPVDSPGLQNSMLLMQFRQFCAELLVMRDRLEGNAAPVIPATPPAAPAQDKATPPEPTATEAAVAAAEAAIAAAQADAAARIAKALGKTPPATEPPPPDAFVEAEALQATEVDEMRSRLLALLEQQTHQTMTFGGAFGIGRLREAQYVMAALGDEVILHAHWPGKTRWRLLEEGLYNTHASGDVFFSKLDTLLKMGEAGSVELAAVYFQALALDFRGKYRGNDPTRQLERYRRQLYLRMFHATPEAMASPALTPQAYDSISFGDEVRTLPNPHRWWIAVAGVLAVWLVVSFVVWEAMTLDLSQQLQRIIAFSHGGRGRLAP